jgi:uncharacterized protein (TIGR02466 family)
MEIKVVSLFPTPVYFVHRDLSVAETEQEVEEVNDVIKEGMHYNIFNFTSDNYYVFETKLKKLKVFCEEHIKNYVKNIINPKGKLDFYITQSWVNVTKKGEIHHKHHHSNSIISGVFYIKTVENDSICFHDPKPNDVIRFDLEACNGFNSDISSVIVNDWDLVLFPSQLEHSVEPDAVAASSTNRISLAFNVFVRGPLGLINGANRLIL